MPDDDSAQLRNDITVLWEMLDAAIDGNADPGLIQACAEILLERKDQLDKVEQLQR